MSTKCNTRFSINFLFLTLSFYGQNSPTVKQDLYTDSVVMKEYVLLFRYPNIAYTKEQLENLKQEWSKTIANWKSKGLYVSNQVFEPKALLVSGKDGKIRENTFAEDDMFLGAIVTLLSQNKEQAIQLAKESPVLSIGGSIEIREHRYNSKNNRVTLIDTFIIPESVREIFINRMNKYRSILKTLPGFVEDHVYEKASSKSNINCITTTVWESEGALANAKKAIIQYNIEENLNLQEFMQKNGITLERAIYNEIER